MIAENSQQISFNSETIKPEPKSTQEKTHPIPYIIPIMLEDHEIIPAEAMVLLILNYHSNFNSGITHYITQAEIAKMMPVDDKGNHISKSHVNQLIKSLISKGIVSVHTKNKGRGQRYQLHFVNGEGNKIDNVIDKFMCPYGTGSPFAKMFACEITWKACLNWVVIKGMRSDYRTGKTHRITHNSQARICHFGTATIRENIRQLQQADLIRRLTKPNLKGCYQLYPKPEKKAIPEKQPSQPKPKHAKQDISIQQHEKTKNWLKNHKLHREHNENKEIDFIKFYEERLKEKPGDVLFTQLLVEAKMKAHKQRE